MIFKPDLHLQSLHEWGAGAAAGGLARLLADGVRGWTEHGSHAEDSGRDRAAGRETAIRGPTAADPRPLGELLLIYTRLRGESGPGESLHLAGQGAAPLPLM